MPLKKISIKTLLLLITFLILTTLTIPMFFWLSRENRALHLIYKERAGVTILPFVQSVNVLLAQHRGTANMFLNGDVETYNHLINIEKSIQQATKDVMWNCNNSDDFMLPLCIRWLEFQGAWNDLRTHYTSLTPSESFAAHSRLISDIHKFQIDIADTSNLSLDSELISYYLQDNLVRVLPTLIENIGQMRGFGSGLAVKTKATEDEKIELSRLSSSIQLTMEMVNWELNKIFSTDAESKTKFNSLLAPIKISEEELRKFFSQNLITVSPIKISSQALFDQATKVINQVNELYLEVAAQLSDRLDKRIQNFIRWRNILIGSYLLIFIVNSLLLIYTIRRIIIPLSQATACLKQIGLGNYHHPITISIDDELGMVLHAINEMQKRLMIDRTQLQQMAQVFEHSHEAIIITDKNNNIVMTNKAFTTITGYSAKDAIGQNPVFLQSGRQDKAFYEMMWKSICSNDIWQGEIWNRRKNGEIYPEWLVILCTRDEDREVNSYIGIFTDITIEKAARKRIEYLAHYDGLTGLINRVTLQDRVGQAITNAKRSQQKLALLFIDLDHFKSINDTLGHAYGDFVLQTTAKRIIECVRESDTIARLGGDELVILLTDLHEAGYFIRVAEQVLESVRQPIELNDQILFVSASIGIAIYPEHGQSYEDLLENADKAMYMSKTQGGNTWVLWNCVEQKASISS